MTDEKPTPDPADDSATEDATVSVPAAGGPDDEPTAAHAEQPATEPAEQPAAQSDEQPAARPAASDDDPDVSYATFSEAFQAITDGPDGVDEAASPQYGVGPFSVREVSLGAIWLVAFVVSFFPIYSYGNRGWGPSVWTGIDWVLTIGVPTVAVFLIGLRRLSPQGIRRVGSLGIDQFASVAFTVSSVVWLGILWSSFVSLGGGSVFLATWVVWVEFILMLAGVVLTVFAPLLPTVGEDFRYRTEVPAHRYARPARPVVTPSATPPKRPSPPHRPPPRRPAPTRRRAPPPVSSSPSPRRPSSTRPSSPPLRRRRSGLSPPSSATSSMRTAPRCSASDRRRGRSSSRIAVTRTSCATKTDASATSPTSPASHAGSLDGCSAPSICAVAT
ncbi:hypothetical protein [Microbacterium hominis]|uniref:hypothetical protein n=1 Tax=Microbacterium hominis TaxID=162426 RepID=UPI000ABBD9AD|nr:hypothetical protein [Microbacterium hominis]